jgi:L-lactate dehydrogenase complex protein LldE
VSRPLVLFPTCLADLLFPSAAAAAERVLTRAGFEVEVREAAVCCGQPAWNSGHVREARRVAVGALRAMEGEAPIVLCGGSCTTMIRHHWPELFEGTPHAGAARAVAERAREFSSFLVDEADYALLEGARVEPRSVAYHDSCHMLRGLGIRDAPRSLLGEIAGVEIRELEGADRCCGFGGTFSVRYPEVSCAMADDKVDDLRAAGVEVLVASDLGCLMHIWGRADARGTPIAATYIAEIIEEALDR